MTPRTLLMLGAALGALCPGIVSAAEAEPTDSALTTVEDVVVTARRRSETLQTVPVAVTSASGEALEARQAWSLDDLASVAPALTVNRSAAFSGSSQTPSVFIRGIGQTDFTLNTDPGVGLYVDGVYVARSVGALLDLVDVDRVEVLRGPQGTLFGRNSIGGALNITTRKPGAARAGRFYATVGSAELRLFGGAFDLPLSENLLTSVAIQSHRQDGYVTRLRDGVKLGDKDNLSGRLAGLWTPTDRLEVALGADFTRSRENGAPLVLTEVEATAAAPFLHNLIRAPMLNPALLGVPGGCTGPAGAAIGGDACYDERWITGDRSTTHATFPTFSNVDTWGGSATVTYDLGGDAALKSITAYRRVKAHASRDGDGSPLEINSTEDVIRTHQFTQEAQWIGEALDGRLSYIVGGFFFDEAGVNPNTVDFGFVRFRSGGAVHNSSAAGFGQATYRLTDQVSATLGVRYTRETKRFTPDQFVLSALVPDFRPGQRLTTSERQVAKADEVTPRADVSYRPREGVLLYASFSKGFKSGGFTQRIFPPLEAPPAYGPETASVYEAGFKLDLFDRRLRLNGAAYLTDYRDLQVTVLVGPAPTVQNAAAARIRGAELEVSAVPAPGLSLTAYAGYTDAYYRSLDARVSPTITLANAFPGVSRWTLGSALAYEAQLGKGLTLTPRVDWSYRSRQSFDAENLVGQEGYGLVDASLTLDSEPAGWSVAVFASNLGDKAYAVHGEQVLNPLGWSLLAPGRGREWGLRLSQAF